MKIHTFSTGTVQITQRWLNGQGPYPLRLMRTLFDSNLTEPMPIWCFLVEHPEGLILIDTGIPLEANQPVWFPPHMRLIQRAASFQINSKSEEINTQLRAAGFSPDDIRWVVLTHLHQDHDGGLHHFPNAEFIVSRTEWKAAQGLMGQMMGYRNTRWPHGFAPTVVDFDQPDPVFGGRWALTGAGDIYLVPTPGHSAGHLSVVVEDGESRLFFAGDGAYSEALLLSDSVDGVGPNARAQRDTHRRILTFAAQQPTVFLPSHEWAARDRLEQRQPIHIP